MGFAGREEPSVLLRPRLFRGSVFGGWVSGFMSRSGIVGFGFRALSYAFQSSGCAFGDLDSVVRVSFRVLGIGFRVLDAGLPVPDFEYRV